MIEFYLESRGSDGSLTPAHDRPMTFPAGEQHLVEATASEPASAEAAGRAAAVVVRGTDMNEYALAGMWLDLARQREGAQAHPSLLVPYLPGARADRGRPFGAKVYADLVNAAAAQASRVVCFDPHSPVMPALIDNLIVVDSTRAVLDAVRLTGLRSTPGGLAGVICPDKGAVERASRVAEALGVSVFQAYKHRDFTTGRLSGFSCEPLPPTGTLLVVDDICDGGGTFRGLAEATGLPAERLALYVSHGVFSGSEEAGAPTLRRHFSRIVTTDSHPGHDRAGVATHILPVLPYLLAAI
jgi:ribose-phosphate pyrophosphokinase